MSRSGVVLDYAFAPGAEAELEALLRAWCGRAGRRGFDTLVIYTSPASPGAALLERLGRATERFFMWTPGIAVPDGAEQPRASTWTPPTSEAARQGGDTRRPQ